MNELLRTLLLLPEQASTFAVSLDTLHYVVILTSIAGAVGVTVAVAVLLTKYHHASPRQRIHRGVSVRAEIVAIIGLLVMFVVFWVIGFRQFVHIQTPPPGALDVYVVAKQWMWEFAYADGTATTDDLYVPANRPIRLLLTSRDVIHSFFVPDFRIKQDVVPGRTRMAWFEAKGPGTHDIFCAEYCGLEHSYMRGRVIVLGDGEWAKWVEGRRGRDDLAVLGGRIAAQRGCLRCHTVDGTPHIGPTWAGMYGASVPLTNGKHRIADEAYITESMMDPMIEIHTGFLPVMPSYRGLLQGGDVAAIVAYIKSLPPPAPKDPLPIGPLPTAPIIEQPEMRR